MNDDDSDPTSPTAAEDRPLQVLLIAGSARRINGCPGLDSKARALERSPLWRELTRNHLEGRTAAFFCYGNEGADELDPDGRPKILRHKGSFDPGQEPFEDERQAYAPLVWQCRYSGIEVPDALWRHATIGEGLPYADNQAGDMAADGPALAKFDAWVTAFVAAHVAGKGLVPGTREAARGARSTTG